MNNSSIQIRQLENASKDELHRIASLHIRAFPSFFLTQLGHSFLYTLYYGYAEDPNSGIVIAEYKNRIIGFIAYSNEYSAFYKRLIKKHLLQFAVCSVSAALQHPSYIKRLLGAFKKSDDVVKEERYVELASICVNPKVGSRGVGSMLIQHLKDIVDFDIYSYINLETDAENNEKANRFYQKNGFVLARTYATAEGRMMNEYRFSPDISVEERE